MLRIGFWRLPQPCYDVADVAGTAPVIESTPPVNEPSSDEGGSLADHEESYGRAARAERAEREPEPSPEPKPDAAAERDEAGKFKPKHRAKSQEASPEDVPRIAALTKRLREAEARAEAAERRPAAAAEPPPTTRAAVPPTQPAADTFPKFETWLDQDGNADKDFYDWMNARDAFTYQRLRAAERQQESQAAYARESNDLVSAYVTKIDAIQKKYPDFDDVVTSAPSVSKAIERAVIEIGPEAAYWLATHPDEAESLSNDTMIDPRNPAFRAVVASTRRYLQTLVASEQRPAPSSRTVAAPTGSALALAPPALPKPPNPGRTTAMREADAPPGDESSLAEHERAYGARRRRG